jgi:glycolate dehydrogenase FAD-binding subunit
MATAPGPPAGGGGPANRLAPADQPDAPALEAVRRASGPEHARAAGPADEVDGLRPSLVAEPGTVEEVGGVMHAATAHGLHVVVRGGGTKLGWGAPPSGVDLILSTTRLDGVLEHAAGDLVVRAQAGVRLADLQRELAPAGQMLALDPPEAGATLGGVVAAAASGPRRLRYGTPRDLLIGSTVVLPDGTVARSGGKVVKNVAGYDLGKLLAGSFGTLAVLVEVIFRLHPLPAARGLATAEVATPERAGACVRALSASTLVPSAVELDWPDAAAPGTLRVLVEGVAPGVEAQTGEAARLLAEHGDARVLEPGEVDAALASLGALPWTVQRPGAEAAEAGAGPAGVLGVKVTCVPSALPGALSALWEVAGAHQLDALVRAHAAVGVLRAALHGGGTAAQAAFVADLRDRLALGGAAVVVQEAAPEVKRAVDVWGPAGDAIGLMRRVKRQFDPSGVLSPGRFVGGI